MAFANKLDRAAIALLEPSVSNSSSLSRATPPLSCSTGFIVLHTSDPEKFDPVRILQLAGPTTYSDSRLYFFSTDRNSSCGNAITR
jgi:hypothetical protein